MARFALSFILLYLTGNEPTCRAGEALQRQEFESVHMGTKWRIVLYANDAAKGKAAAKAAFARVAELDNVMSDYNQNSELMKLCLTNDAKPGMPIPVSEDLYIVLKQGQGIAESSDGAFDMTVGPMVKLWRTARKTRKLPASEELISAKKLVGYRMLKLDSKGKTVSLEKAGMRLDLGGIGKGFAADAAMTILKKHNIQHALIAASGDISVSRAPPSKDAWIVEIAPIGTGKSLRYIQLVNASVSTSGDLFQYVEIDGVRYSHVLNPYTGLGLTGRRSATVIAKQGWLADALTKTASVLSPDRAIKLIEKLPGAALYLVVKETDDAKEVILESPRFKDFEVKE